MAGEQQEACPAHAANLPAPAFPAVTREGAVSNYWLDVYGRSAMENLLLLERRLGDTTYEKRPVWSMITCSWYNKPV